MRVSNEVWLIRDLIYSLHELLILLAVVINNFIVKQSSALLQNNPLGLGAIFPSYNFIATAATRTADANANCPDCPPNLPVIANTTRAATEAATLAVRQIQPHTIVATSFLNL